MSRRSSLTKSLSSVFLSSKEKKDDGDENTPTFLQSSSLGPQIATILEKYADKIHDDSFLKIVRQLEFWFANQKLPEDELLALTERLAKTASWREVVDDESIPDEQKFKIPTVRYGRTELQMPIITCGGMRIQETWIPDNTPLLRSNKSKVVKSKSQDNLKDVILSCLKLGLNHFETARFYGSSEVQFVDALVNLMENGTIQREDFIFQTKLMAGATSTKEDFAKQWEASWSNVDKLGYVDLLSFHCVSDSGQVDNILSEDKDGLYNFILGLQEEGKIKHIGFSTHGDAENIMRMINSNKFDYVNLHKHFFGDYHAAGTLDTLGGQGNEACVKRALELDMGVFNISPFDKGGKLYRPSAAVAAAIGPEMSPIAFAALHSWKTMGMHTVSVGFARSSDLDEVIEAAKIYAEGDKATALVKVAEDRLKNLAIEKLGQDWYQKGLLKIPSFYDKTSDGIAIGHVLWLHNCLTAFGLYEFSKDRYGNLEATSWSKSKSYEENVKKNFNTGNPGRSFDESVDLTEALKDHYDPELAKSKLVEVHNWLKKDASMTDEDKAERGWKQAYNLTTWEEFPGEVVSASNVLLSRMGIKKGGGNKKEAVEEAKSMRGIVRRKSSLILEGK
eukprot:CAMPEP_0113546118 /NCGR_PEP_ID=MMETSP0015_2-20120614/11632_1 /TAXON_ID=2838 /ORGANISM="Odontella" /LENGTH=618 /DNA_ID=CAMNT_0000446545 /DNA_START=8 /DNA_END=1864 /DNA_ORIENTATION=+ /assembly_acc=CAM_ASM_000160